MVVLSAVTCAVPVACAVHPDDIMLLPGIVIVNVMSSPFIVPENVPGVRPPMPEPEKLIDPATLDPVCVSGHVMAPMPVWPIMLPAPNEMLESEAVPDHVPAIVAVAVGETVPQAAAKPINRMSANAGFMVSIVAPNMPAWYSDCDSAVLRCRTRFPAAPGRTQLSVELFT